MATIGWILVGVAVVAGIAAVVFFVIAQPADPKPEDPPTVPGEPDPPPDPKPPTPDPKPPTDPLPPIEPEPDPPSDPELPEGKYGLAAKVRSWVAEKVPADQHAKLPALAESFRQAHVEGQLAGKTIGDLRIGLKLRNSTIIGNANQAWEQFSFRLASTLNDLEATLQIKNVRDYAQAMLEVSEGLAAENLLL